MSQKFPGGFITKSPVAPTTTAASGVWTLDQQEQYQQAGTWPSPPPPPYIEDVFSTYLYTGTGATQTITNNIDLSTKGGLVWCKARSSAENNFLFDTVRGATFRLVSNSTLDQRESPDSLTAFTSSGFTLGGGATINQNGITNVSWTFRKQPKFFDVQTFTAASGSFSATFSHNLGSVPGCVIFKSTTNTTNWYVWHRSLASTDGLYLNTTGAVDPIGANWLTATSTTVSINGSLPIDNATYVAYLFAHNAGGFGATETENVISCGSLTTDSSGNGSVTLGYEPQWVLIKRTDDASQWYLGDNMRGMPVSGAGARLFPNLSNAESTSTSWIRPNATGFTLDPGMFAVATNLIYIAIRRGPMKTPTDATKVFAPVTYTGNGTGSSPPTITTNFPVDMTMWRDLRTGVASSMISYNSAVFDRLRGNQNELTSSATDAEDTSWGNSYLRFDSNTSILLGSDVSYLNKSGSNYVSHAFRRAPSFFDEVCYTGTYPTVNEVNHNLGVVPELIINKSRSAVANSGWPMYVAPLGISQVVRLNSTASAGGSSGWNDQPPTATQFFVNGYNTNGVTYVAYLFASCPGVSKVGSYTGTGTLTTINCGFTGGARFVLIKRTDSASNWFVWDTARGMVSGTDPSLNLNNTDAESNANSVYTATTGFQLLASPSADVNTSGGSYIYLAIA